MDLLLKNCRILNNDNLIITNIIINNGKIDSITDEEINANKVIDCTNKIILPGLIDPHVHFREPGMEHKEDFLTGSCAAVVGGITTILDMPNTKPPIFTVEELENKRRLAKKSIVNYGFYFGASADNNIEEIKKALLKRDIAGIKIYMNDTTGNLLITDDVLLDKIFQCAKVSNKIVAVHAEGVMVRTAVELAKKHNNRLYLCHISTKDEIDYLRKNKTDNIFVEVTPHHLLLTENDDKDAFTKMKPSLKSQHDQQTLLEAITEGIVDTIGTDHAPHTIEEKEAFKFPHGVPGCETMLPLLLNAINEGKFNLTKIQKLCCENPAKIFRIKNKGFIKEGYDADLVVIDMEIEKDIENEKLFTKCKWSPFSGKKIKGWPIMTIVNGKIIYDYNNGKPILKKEIHAKEVTYNV